MSSFNTMYKQTFKQLLIPKGYSIWKSVFYKEVDNNICFFVHGKKVNHSNVSSAIAVYVDATPYCVDLKSDEYEPQEGATMIADIIIKLFPDKYALENIREYYITRFLANTEIDTLNSLNNICTDMDEIILPYVHKCTDLEFLYNEMSKIWGISDNDIKRCNNSYSYGLSLKLHKYDAALRYIEYKSEWHENIIERKRNDLAKLKNGNVSGTFDICVSDEFTSSLLRKKPGYIESQIKASEVMIKQSESEISKLNSIREAILARDYSYLDGVVLETEESSRIYIRQMLGRAIAPGE